MDVVIEEIKNLQQFVIAEERARELKKIKDAIIDSIRTNEIPYYHYHNGSMGYDKELLDFWAVIGDETYHCPQDEQKKSEYSDVDGYSDDSGTGIGDWLADLILGGELPDRIGFSFVEVDAWEGNDFYEGENGGEVDVDYDILLAIKEHLKNKLLGDD